MSRVMITAMAGEGSGWRSPLRPRSVLILLAALLLTAAAVAITAVGVHDQEHRLLKERTNEVNDLLASATSQITSRLQDQGRVLQFTHDSTRAYTKAAGEALASGNGQIAFAWLRATSSGFVVAAAAGPGLVPGQLISDARASVFAQAMHTQKMVPSPVIGPQRLIGFALGAPAAPAGTVLYEQNALGKLRAPTQAGTAPYSELEVALYATKTVVADQVLVSTTPHLPLRGATQTGQVPVGNTSWLLVVKAKRSLVGNIASDSPWLFLAAGLVVSLLVGVSVEASSRRRDAALALYASEHQTAETLQRSLLPQLPQLPGLETAARYLAGGDGQQVGGDWFDVFPVPGGRVGLAVGDVMGHDLAAASAMAQIRSTLRAYAFEADQPAAVLTRLRTLVDSFGLAQLVTVVYGLLDAPDDSGNRTLRYCNAGHLAPLLRRPDGTVQALEDASSVVIGAPLVGGEPQGQMVLEPGSMLVMFTDGLIESPTVALGVGLDRLSQLVASADASTAEQLCEDILTDLPRGEQRDDIALLTVRLNSV